MNVFQQFGVFDPLVFQHEGIAGVITQTLPAFSQSSVGEVCKPLFQPSVYQRNVFGGCEAIAPVVSGEIHQTLSALTQHTTGSSSVQVIEISRGGVQPIPAKVKGDIIQFLPSLTQDVEANVNDDIFVLLLL